ncbi:MAG: CoA-binding protein [Sulfurospirillum sp.]|nr:CoA-binding protein [Sulfurospirillum sp.]
MQCPMPTINTNDDKKLKEIFENTQNIAIVGLSPDPTKASHIVAKYLQEKGFVIFPVYPKEEFILGQKVYRSLSEIPKRIDMVDMFRKPAFGDELVLEAQKRGDIKYFWLQLGIVNNEACHKAEEFGMVAVQNKCTKIEYQRLFR